MQGDELRVFTYQTHASAPSNSFLTSSDQFSKSSHITDLNFEVCAVDGRFSGTGVVRRARARTVVMDLFERAWRRSSVAMKLVEPAMMSFILAVAVECEKVMCVW